MLENKIETVKNNLDPQYFSLLRYILENGTDKSDRTGTGTRSIFGYQMRFNFQEGFPLLTTKRLHFKSIAIELLWMLSGSTNTKFLTDNGVTIWNEWADKNTGELGPVYGKQMRDSVSYYPKFDMLPNHVKEKIAEANSHEWETIIKHKDELNKTLYWEYSIDQIKKIMWQIKNTPDSRRIILNLWNLPELEDMKLEPCHYTCQFYVVDNKLSCKLLMRSNDIFLGNPYNIASYSLLTHMIAQQCNLEVGELIWSGGDCHIYNNHMEQVKEQLTRDPYDLPKLILKRKPDSIFDYNYDDFEVVNYKAHPSIKAKVAV